jgi:hypothetical protein
MSNAECRMPNDLTQTDMKVHSILALVLALGVSLGAWVGCRSTPTQVDRGPITARTFNFIGNMPKPTPGYADQRQVVHTLVQRAITNNLSPRGIQQVPNNGDVIVAYLIIVGNNASTMSINDYFGYREDAEALHAKTFSAYTGSKNPGHFEAGTLIIDFIDPKSYKLLRRGHATRPVLRNATEEVRAERIQSVVDEILREVRVTP